MFAESLDSHGNSEVGLSRTRRAYAEDDGIILYSVGVALLTDSTGAEYLARGSDAYAVAAQLLKLFLNSLSHHGGDIPYGLFVDGASVLCHVHNSAEGFFGALGIAFADYLNAAVTTDDSDVEVLLYSAYIAVQLTEKSRELLGAVGRQEFF